MHTVRLKLETDKPWEDVKIMFVTHDIEEALTLGTKVMVMDQGQIVQYDTPEVIKTHPANAFVAQLVSRTQ